jgi:tetratricopeptide (TPR) repeat protein
VERARIASTVRSRVDEAVQEFRALDEHPDPGVGARVLDVWTGLRRRQGQTNNVRILQGWLVERYPNTDQAAQVVFLRGDRAQDQQDWDGAISQYRKVTSMAPTRSLAGLAWMRIGQIHLQRGDDSSALEAY